MGFKTSRSVTPNVLKSSRECFQSSNEWRILEHEDDKVLVFCESQQSNQLSHYEGRCYQEASVNDALIRLEALRAEFAQEGLSLVTRLNRSASFLIECAAPIDTFGLEQSSFEARLRKGQDETRVAVCNSTAYLWNKTDTLVVRYAYECGWGEAALYKADGLIYQLTIDGYLQDGGGIAPIVVLRRSFGNPPAKHAEFIEQERFKMYSGKYLCDPPSYKTGTRLPVTFEPSRLAAASCMIGSSKRFYPLALLGDEHLWLATQRGSADLRVWLLNGDGEEEHCLGMGLEEFLLSLQD